MEYSLRDISLHTDSNMYFIIHLYRGDNLQGQI